MYRAAMVRTSRDFARVCERRVVAGDIIALRAAVNAKRTTSRETLLARVELPMVLDGSRQTSGHSDPIISR